MREPQWRANRAATGPSRSQRQLSLGQAYLCGLSFIVLYESAGRRSLSGGWQAAIAGIPVGGLG